MNRGNVMKWFIAPDVSMSASGWPAILIIAILLIWTAEAVLFLVKMLLHLAHS